MSLSFPLRRAVPQINQSVLVQGAGNKELLLQELPVRMARQTHMKGLHEGTASFQAPPICKRALAVL